MKLPFEERIIEDKSKADEMFEKLGYIEHFNTEYAEVFRTDSSHSFGHSIEFLTKSHKVFNTYNSITMQELQAINEKVEELGWNE